MFTYFYLNFQKSDKNYKPVVVGQITPIQPLKDFDNSSNSEDRQSRIDDVINTKGKDYPRYFLTKNGPKDLIITYYKFDFKNIDPNKRDRRGILVFKEKTPGDIKLIWESTDDDISATWSIIGTHDLTGDGIKEIVVLWQYDRSESLYVYKWNGTGLEYARTVLAYSCIFFVVEHAIGGMKRFGAASHIFRNKKGTDDMFMNVCAGLWNLELETT